MLVTITDHRCTIPSDERVVVMNDVSSGDGQRSEPTEESATGSATAIGCDDPDAFQYLGMLRAKGLPDIVVVLRIPDPPNGIVYRWQPESRQWMDSPTDFSYAYGHERNETRPLTRDEAEREIAENTHLFELTPEARRRIADLIRSEREDRDPDDPYW